MIVEKKSGIRKLWSLYVKEECKLTMKNGEGGQKVTLSIAENFKESKKIFVRE